MAKDLDMNKKLYNSEILAEKNLEIRLRDSFQNLIFFMDTGKSDEGAEH